VATCQTAGSKCSTTSDCCYGLTCGSGGIVPLSQQATGTQNPAIVYPITTCQTSGVTTL
jgi:hypothetical protein